MSLKISDECSFSWARLVVEYEEVSTLSRKNMKIAQIEITGSPHDTTVGLLPFFVVAWG